MTPAQRDRTLALIEAYAHNMRADLAEQELRALHEAGPEKLHFAWAGPAERGTCHYYRLHGPTMLVEYDNTEPNHTHTVWHNPRDPSARTCCADIMRRRTAEPGVSGRHPGRAIDGPTDRIAARRRSRGRTAGTRAVGTHAAGNAGIVRPQRGAAAPAGRSWATPGS